MRYNGIWDYFYNVKDKILNVLATKRFSFLFMIQDMRLCLVQPETVLGETRKGLCVWESFEKDVRA